LASARVLPGHGRKKTLTGGAHAVVREEGEGAERAGRRVWAGVLAGMETGCSLSCGGRKGKKREEGDRAGWAEKRWRGRKVLHFLLK